LAVIVPRGNAKTVAVLSAAKGIVPRTVFVIVLMANARMVIAPRPARAAVKALARTKLPVAAILCPKKVAAATKNKDPVSAKLLKTRAKKPLFLVF